MARDLPGLTEWEMRPVPYSDRAPIAEKTLDILGKIETSLTLSMLDTFDLFALIRILGEDETLMGLVWITESPDQEDAAVIPLLWNEELFLEEAVAAMKKWNEGLDDWARDRGKAQILYYCKMGHKKTKDFSVWSGFKVTPLRQFVRKISMEGEE